MALMLVLISSWTFFGNFIFYPKMSDVAETKKSNLTIPTVPALITIGVLIFLCLLFLILALFYYKTILDRSETLNQNPYAIRYGCGQEGTLPVPINLTPEEDPQRNAFQRVNFCIVNAPPEDLVNAMQTCTNKNSTALQTQLANLASFYNNVYTPICGYAWKSEQVPLSPTASEAPNFDQLNPNGELLNGGNDPFMTYFIACAETNGLGDNEDILALKVKNTP